jgi:hypothetical protein
MKALKFTSIAVVVVFSALLLQSVALAKKGGTSILHFMVRTTMVATNVEPSATGSIDAKLNQQGHADNQRLTIAVGHLDGNTTYQLWALLGDDTNLTEIADFETDANGDALLRYSHVGSSHGHGHGPGDPLPAALDPLSNIRELVVQNSSTQEVLNADLTSPSRTQYLVKRTMTNDGIELGATASLRIHASQKFVQFRIDASGLTTTSTYFLAINNDIASELTSDSHGRLRVNALPGGSPDILDIHELAILNSSSNSVLSTLLP